MLLHLLRETDAGGQPAHLPSLRTLCIHHNLRLVGACKESSGVADPLWEEAEYILGREAGRCLEAVGAALKGGGGCAQGRGGGAAQDFSQDCTQDEFVEAALGEVLESRGIRVVEAGDGWCECGLCRSF